jgi:hypothetical protein
MTTILYYTALIHSIGIATVLALTPMLKRRIPCVVPASRRRRRASAARAVRPFDEGI